MTKRPIEADYNSHVAYTRALEAYCDSLEQPAVEQVAELDLFVDENGPCLTFTPKWYGHLPNGNHKLYAAPQAPKTISELQANLAAQERYRTTDNEGSEP